MLAAPAAAGDAKEADRLRGQAQAATARKDYAEAERLLAKAFEADPNPALLKDLAVTFASDGKIAESAATYKRYLGLVPDDTAARLALATTLSWSKDKALLAESEALLSAFIAQHPESDEALLQRARVRSWSGKSAASEVDFRAYLAKHPNEEKVRLELAMALSSSKDKSALNGAIAIYDEHLKKHPGDLEIVLQRARVASWAGRTAEAIAGYDAYLAAKPDDEAVKLELARARSWSGQGTSAVAGFREHLKKHPDDEKAWLDLASALSASKDKAVLREAIAIFDRHLQKHPDDLPVLLQRARVRGWVGQTAEAVADFRTYQQKNPSDESIELEIANVLAQGTTPKDSIPVYDGYIARHPGDTAARMKRARALLWAGDYGRAESELDALRTLMPPGPERDLVELDLARLLSQTGRLHSAMDLVEEVLEHDPNNAGALKERDRLGIVLGSRIEPGFFFYTDKSRIQVASLTVATRVNITRNFAVVGDVGGWSLGTALETLRAGRANLGAWGRIKSLELEAAAGPRVYEFFGPNFGARAAARLVPTSWSRLSLDYHYDDIYFDMLQPASISAGVRGHASHLTGDVTLPYRVRVSGRAGVRLLEPDNRGFNSTATVSVPVVGPVTVGYNVQWLTWRFNDPAYWSPQSFASHLGIVRLAQSFAKLRFGYDLQGVAGIAGERIKGAPETGFGFSFGTSGAVTYTPFDRLVLRLGVQYSQTIREVPLPPTGGSTGTGTALERRTTPSRYWWLAGTGSAMVYF